MSKPADANDECVGPESEQAGKASSCAGCPNQSSCASGEGPKAPEVDPAIASAMARVKQRVLVLSGKGGVGKSTFSTQLAYGLARRGLKVGLLDLDICGPSIPTMLGLQGREVHQSNSGWSPVFMDVQSDEDAPEEGELCVMSIGFLMPDSDSAVIWRGPRKTGLISQFLGSVDYGELDYLVVDTPPGTSDEHISIVQLLKPCFGPTDGAVVVTTPQEVAMADVRKELNFCKQTGINVLGIVENMAPMKLPFDNLSFFNTSGKDCTEDTLKELKEKCPSIYEQMRISVDVFPRAGGGPEKMAKVFDVPYIGQVPLNRELQNACDRGDPSHLSGENYLPIRNVVQHVIDRTNPTLLEEKKRAALEEKKVENTGKSGVVSIQGGKMFM